MEQFTKVQFDVSNTDCPMQLLNEPEGLCLFINDELPIDNIKFELDLFSGSGMVSEHHTYMIEQYPFIKIIGKSAG